MEEDIETSDLSLDEKIQILLKDLPLPIQNFVRSPERDSISLNLSQKYGLHADDAGVFERSYIFMLLGVFTPQEFMQELRDAGLEEPVVRGLAADINDQVFKRLRQEERQEPAAPGYRSERPAPKVPPMQLANHSLISARETLPKSVSTSTPVAAHSSQDIPRPHPRTMAGDMEMASHGMMGQPATPARSFQTASVPITSTQPAAAPIAPPAFAAAPPPEGTHQFAPPPAAPPPPSPAPSAPPATAPIRLTPVDRFHSNAPIAKEYGSDPYREPIE